MINHNDNINIICRLENQTKRVIISNVPPTIPLTYYITDALNFIDINIHYYAEFLLKSWFSAEDLPHIINLNCKPTLNINILVHFEGTDYHILLTNDALTRCLCTDRTHTSAHAKKTTQHIT